MSAGTGVDVPAGHVLCVGLTPALQETRRIPRLTHGAVLRVQAAPIVTPAGKACNAARVLHALGVSTRVTGFCGGAVGARLVALLDAEGISHRFTPIAGETRVCTTLVDPDGATEIVDPSPDTTPDEWTALHADVRHGLTGACVVVIAGKLPDGGSDDTYAEFVRAARARDLPVVIDSQGEPFLRALAAQPTVCKLNTEELAATTGRDVRTPDAIAAAALELRQRGPAHVLVTQGREVAVLAGPDGVTAFTPPTVKTVNAVGSGDACSAGITAGIARGLNMVAAVRLGIACGAANAATLTAGDVDPVRVTALLEQVSVAPLGTSG